MNLVQMELRRTEDLLRKVREARHVCQMMRKPLAQYIRLEHRIAYLVNTGVRRVNAVHETSFETWDVEVETKTEELKQNAKILAKLETQVQARIKKLKDSPKLHAASKPIEERIKARRAKTKRERQAFRRIAEKRTKLNAEALAFIQRSYVETGNMQAELALSSIERFWRAGSVKDVKRLAKDFARSTDPIYRAMGLKIEEFAAQLEALNNEAHQY